MWGYHKILDLYTKVHIFNISWDSFLLKSPVLQ